MNDGKEYYQIANCGLGFERTYVRVSSNDMGFWMFQHDDLLDRYAFDWDNDNRESVRQMLSLSSCFPTDFAKDWSYLGGDRCAWHRQDSSNRRQSFSGCKDFQIFKKLGVYGDDGRELIFDSRKFYCPPSKYVLEVGWQYEEVDREEGEERKFGEVDLFEFHQKNILEQTTKFELGQGGTSECIIDLCREKKGSFGEYAIRVDAGTFDLMKLKIKRTELFGDDYQIKSVEYDGKEVEVNTDANGGDITREYHNYYSNYAKYSSHDRTS